MDRLVTQSVKSSLFRFRYFEYMDRKQGEIVPRFREYEENASCDLNHQQRIWVFVRAFKVSANLETESVCNITVTRFKSSSFLL